MSSSERNCAPREPTDGNQPSIIDEIADLLHVQRHKRGLAIVLVERNLDGEVVLHICEEVWATYGLPPGSAPCARPSGLALGPRGML